MSKNVIFCYSGSGNCLDIAKNISKYLMDTDIIMMRSVPAVTDVRNAKRVGFVFPCYAGGLPGNVENFVKSLRIDPKAYVFGVVSYSGYPGIGLKLIDDLVHFDNWTGISHACSCIWLLPRELMLPPISLEKAQLRSEKLARKFAYEILDGKVREKRPSAPLLNKAESKMWPILAKLKSRKMTSSDACIGCGQCETLCPKGNITLKDGRPSFGTDCIQCLSCLQYCPVQAINLGGASIGRERYHNVNISAEELNSKVIHID